MLETRRRCSDLSVKRRMTEHVLQLGHLMAPEPTLRHREAVLRLTLRLGQVQRKKKMDTVDTGQGQGGQEGFLPLSLFLQTPFLLLKREIR